MWWGGGGGDINVIILIIYIHEFCFSYSNTSCFDVSICLLRTLNAFINPRAVDVVFVLFCFIIIDD